MQQLLAGCTDSDIDAIKRYMVTRKAATGTILVEMGATDRDMYILEEGGCEVYQQVMMAGKPFAMRVGKIEAPALLGEANLLMGEKRNATVIVSKDTTCRVLSHTAYQKMKEENPALAVKLLEAINIQVSRRFLDSQKLWMEKLISTSPSPEMGLDYLKKILGNVTPCSPGLAKKLFKLNQPRFNM